MMKLLLRLNSFNILLLYILLSNVIDDGQQFGDLLRTIAVSHLWAPATVGR